jgi:hypothetical protein
MRPVDWSKWSGILALTFVFGNVASAQQEEEADLQKQIEELKQGQEAIRKDIADIKRLLQAIASARAAAPSAPAASAAPDVRNVVLDVGKNPFRGEPGAKLALVEFTDYQ